MVIRKSIAWLKLTSQYFKERKLHWFFLAVLFSIISFPFIASFSFSEENFVDWISAIAALLSALAAILAAVLLRKTLAEAQASTILMRQQLQQNRAYMTVDVTDLLHLHDDFGVITGVLIRINWKNTGGSPALNVKSGGACGFARLEEEVDLEFEGFRAPDIEIGEIGSVVAVGSRSMGAARFSIAEIADSIDREETPVVYSYCRYSDIYGRVYWSQFTARVVWSVRILDPAFTVEVLERGTELVPIGSRNGEFVVEKKK